ncbi:MAG: integrase core domain-containing protein [Beijerinckiaceae bacterium]
MAECEQACAARAIPRHVLPPRSPRLNGGVERCNGAWRYEFHAVVNLPSDIAKIADQVDAFEHLYNRFRPRGALDGKTPSRYHQICRDRNASPSQCLSPDTDLTDMIRQV